MRADEEPGVEPDASLVTSAPEAPERDAAPVVAPGPARRRGKVPALVGAGVAAAARAGAGLRPHPPAAPE